MISHVTKDCQQIYCLISRHHALLFNKTLNIIPSVEHAMEGSKANFSIDDNKHNSTVVHEEITEPTYEEPANSSNIIEIDDVDYDNDSHSSGNVVTIELCVLYVALALVLLSLM